MNHIGLKKHLSVHALCKGFSGPDPISAIQLPWQQMHTDDVKQNCFLVTRLEITSLKSCKHNLSHDCISLKMTLF